MATGFTQLYHNINSDEIGGLIAELISFFNDNSISLCNKDGNILCLDEEGERFTCSHSDLMNSIRLKGSVSLLWETSDWGRLYNRLRVINDNVFSEEYDVGGMSHHNQEAVNKLMLERIKNLISDTERSFIGGVIDQVGYSEVNDWDEFFLSNRLVDIVDKPTVICASFFYLGNEDSIQIEAVKDFRIIYYDQLR